MEEYMIWKKLCLALAVMLLTTNISWYGANDDKRDLLEKHWREDLSCKLFIPFKEPVEINRAIPPDEFDMLYSQSGFVYLSKNECQYLESELENLEISLLDSIEYRMHFIINQTKEDTK